MVDDDCAFAEVTNACPGDGLCCANAALNRAAAADVTSALLQVATGPSCPCIDPPWTARCVSGACAIVVNDAGADGGG
jgi:hypothetical protein